MDSKENQLSRRNFLRISSTASLAASMLPLIGPVEKMTPTAKVALQLYSVRNELEKDFSGTLRRLAGIGLKTVETAFWPKEVTIKQAAKNVKDAGLSVSSCHIDIPIGDKKSTMLIVAESFDCKRMIWHGWPEDKRYDNLDGTKELVGIYNEASNFAKSNGLEFGLHNHWWEYRNRVGGRFVYEWLLEGVDKDVFFEIDTYWVKVAGQDPAAIIEKFGSRAPLLHMKDGPALWNDSLPKDNPDPMVALGTGTQNFPAIVRAADDHVKYMIIEMDKVATDVFQAIEKSYQYLITNRFAID
jgi:sugar phosphate isomerase/epimerase